MEAYELNDVSRTESTATDAFTHDVDLDTVNAAGWALAAADSSEVPRYEVSLAPVDGGFQAWTLVSIFFAFHHFACSLMYSQLAVAFLIEVLVWGFPNSFGVLLAAYLQDPVYNSQVNAATLLPLTGTLCTGIMYCSCKQCDSQCRLHQSHYEVQLSSYIPLCIGIREYVEYTLGSARFCVVPVFLQPASPARYGFLLLKHNIM